MRIVGAAALLALVVGSCAGTSDADDRSVDGCALSSSGVSTGRNAEVCAFFVQRFRTLLADEVMAGSLHLTDDAGFLIHHPTPVTWRVDWPRRELFPRGADGPADKKHITVFWHEVGHMWLGPLMEGGRRVSVGDRYGTEAPDWLDEAWALWAEPAADRSRRLRQLRSDTMPSLRKLTELGHPLFDPNAPVALHGAEEVPVSRTKTIESPCRGACVWVPDSARGMYKISEVRRYADGRVDTSVMLSATRPDASSRDTFEEIYFYPLSYSLLRYIRETGGEAAVRELIARYRVDPTPRAEALANLPGMPSTIEAVEAGWHAFLAERRPEPR